MARLTPVSRRKWIDRLRRLGFEGPYTAGGHEFLISGARRLIVPDLNRAEIGADLLARLLRQAGVSRDDWDSTA